MEDGLLNLRNSAGLRVNDFLTVYFSSLRLTCDQCRDIDKIFNLVSSVSVNRQVTGDREARPIAPGF